MSNNIRTAATKSPKVWQRQVCSEMLLWQDSLNFKMQLTLKLTTELNQEMEYHR